MTRFDKATDYPPLFAAIDALAPMMPPDWPTVLRCALSREKRYAACEALPRA